LDGITIRASKTIAALATATPIRMGAKWGNDDGMAREESMAGT
jgi:hypothetical protein